MSHRPDRPATPVGTPVSAADPATDRVPPGFVGAALATIAGVLVVLGIAHHWSMTSVSTRQDVAQAVENLTPACRPIMAARFRAELLRQGRPLTRAEVQHLADGIEDCAAIEDQVSGLQG